MPVKERRKYKIIALDVKGEVVGGREVDIINIDKVTIVRYDDDLRMDKAEELREMFAKKGIDCILIPKGFDICELEEIPDED